MKRRLASVLCLSASSVHKYSRNQSKSVEWSEQKCRWRVRVVSVRLYTAQPVCLSVLVSAVFDLLITNKKKEERKDAIKNEDSENVRAATIKVRHDSSGVDPVSSSINYQGNIYVCKQYYEKIVGWY